VGEQALEDIERFLAAGEWFGSLSAALRQRMLALCVIRKYDRGQVISLEESAARGLYAVLEGQVHLVRDIGGGEEGLVHVGEPGFWFGEYALLTGRLTVVTAVAHTPARLLFLSKAKFDGLVAEDPLRYPKFARLVFDRYALLLRAIVQGHDMVPEARLRQRIALLGALRAREQPDAGPPVLAISQANLAKMVGVSRQTLNTMLGSLQRQGLIELGFKSIRVLDAIGLVAFVAGPARRKPIARSRPDRRGAVPKSHRDGPARR